MVCERCGTELLVGMYPFCRNNPKDHGTVYSKTSAFPFETTHVTGKPMVIESLQHLRKVEREAGVVFSAFSKTNERDLDPIKDLPKFNENFRR